MYKVKLGLDWALAMVALKVTDNIEPFLVKTCLSAENFKNILQAGMSNCLLMQLIEKKQIIEKRSYTSNINSVFGYWTI